MRDIYIENIRMVSLIAGFKMEGIVKWRGLNRRDHCTTTVTATLPVLPFNNTQYHM